MMNGLDKCDAIREAEANVDPMVVGDGAQAETRAPTREEMLAAAAQELLAVAQRNEKLPGMAFVLAEDLDRLERALNGPA